MEEKIYELLSEEFPAIDFKGSDTLVDDGILDSLTMKKLLKRTSIRLPGLPRWSRNFQTNRNRYAVIFWI